MRSNTEICSHGRPQAWARGRHLPSPGKVEKMLSRQKPYRQSQFEWPRRWLFREVRP